MTKALLGAIGAAILFSGPAMAAETYTFDPIHTSVIWNTTHHGKSSPHGIFSNIEGTLVLDEAAPENSKINVTVPTGLVATGIPKFDEHLKTKDFFNSAEFPAATFVSTTVEKTGDKTAKVTGDLTLIGVTKPVTLDVVFNEKGVNPMNQKETVGFSASGVVKRSEFGMGYGIPNIGDDVKIQIEAEANK